MEAEVSRNENPRAAALRALFTRLIPRKVENWTDSKDMGEVMPLETTMRRANIITSRYADGAARHALLLDIDHPCWLVKSSTPGHYHLYVDVPGGIAPGYWESLINALANAGVIEKGYAKASIARGYSSLRFPWIKKEA